MSLVTELIPLVGILIPAAMSPGPNNSIVFYTAVHQGAAAVVSPIIAVITGSSVLFAITLTSLGMAASNMAEIRLVIVLFGAAYLFWLGMAMFNAGQTHSDSDLSDSALPNTFLRIFIFQLANPKSWVMMGIVSAHGSHTIHWSILLLTVSFVFGTCLTLWAAVGRVLSGCLQTPRFEVVFNKTMGLTLIFFAAMLPLQMNW